MGVHDHQWASAVEAEVTEIVGHAMVGFADAERQAAART
jgi:hypothetical protein